MAREQTPLIAERDGSVTTLTLNRPAQLNAVTPEMIDPLDKSLRAAISDPEVRVVRLRGAGEGFCAGTTWNGRAHRWRAQKPPARGIRWPTSTTYRGTCTASSRCGAHPNSPSACTRLQQSNAAATGRPRR